MDNTENQNSQEEVVLPSADSTEIQQDAQPDVVAKTEPDPQDADWVKKLRRDRKDAVRRAEDAEKRMKMQEELMNKFISQPAVQPQSNDEDFLHELAKEEYVPGAKVATGLKKLEEKFDRKVREIEAKYEKTAKGSLFASVKSEYADFDQVVNPETLDLIEETNPRLAASLFKTMNEDPYSFAVQSYEYIKSKGLAKSSQPEKTTEVDRRIAQNKKTVQSPQAFDKRPMAQAFQLDDKMKADLAKEMYHYANQAGMGY